MLGHIGLNLSQKDEPKNWLFLAHFEAKNRGQCDLKRLRFVEKCFDDQNNTKTYFNQLGKHIPILCLVYFGQKATILEPFSLSALCTDDSGVCGFFLPLVQDFLEV